MSSSSPSNTRSPSPNTAKPRAPRKINTPPRDRIDSILEQARDRKLTMNTTEATPRGNDGLLRERRTSPTPEPDGSADEETSIFPRSNQSMNYLSTQTQAKPRQSTESIRRAGQIQEPAAQNVDESHDDDQQSWWQRLISEYGSLELENKGSVARDHLALERTFLAWLRTSLAFASIGIAITQLFRLNTSAADSLNGDPYRRLRSLGKPLGATFIGISIVMLFVGFHRYFESQHWIIRGKFPASRGSIALVAIITFALMVTSLVVVCVVEPSAFEKR